jgi:hypothetical protein
MERLLGIFMGSALAIAALIIVAGIPELTLDDNRSPIEESRATLPLMPDAGTTSAELAQPTAPVETGGTAVLPIEEPRNWYAFWSPFRSRIAASGFVAQLQRVTGLDYRVVRVKPGVYEVAFAYSDDVEIQANLVQISEATGLDVPGS